MLYFLKLLIHAGYFPRDDKGGSSREDPGTDRSASNSRPARILRLVKNIWEKGKEI